MSTLINKPAFYLCLTSSLLAIPTAFAQTDMYGRDLSENLMLKTPEFYVPRMSSSNVKTHQYSDNTLMAVSSLADSQAIDASFFTVGEAYRPGSARMESVDIGDVDGDGDLEVVALSAYSSDDFRNSVFIFHPTKSGLGEPQYFSYNGSANRPSISVADLNGDGADDISIGRGQGISVFSWNGLGSYNEQFYSSTRLISLDAIDIDLDNDLDLIGLPWSAPAYQYFNDSGAIVSDITLATFASGYNDQAIGDLNNDGIDDFVAMSGQSYSTPNFSVHLHDGSEGLLAPQSYFVGQNETTRGVSVGDFNGDGLDDIALSRGRNSPTHLWVYTQDPEGELIGPLTVPSYQIPQKIQSADLDNNGYDDLVVLHGGWSRIGIYLNDENGFGEEILVQIPYASHYWAESLRLADMDKDGCPETFFVAEYNHGVYPVYSELCELAAQPIHETVSGTLEAYWKREIEISVAGGIIELSADYQGGNIDLFILDGDENYLGSSRTDSNPETLTYDTKGQAGTYKVKVYNSSDETSSYVLNYSYLPLGE